MWDPEECTGAGDPRPSKVDLAESNLSQQYNHTEEAELYRVVDWPQDHT